MTRLLLFLLLLPVLGCQQASVPAQTPLKPVVVDQAAAYPSQEPKTRPPILTGFAPLTKEQLDDGWVQLFDGVSTFGWVVSEGEGTLSVMTDGTKNYLVFERKDQRPITISHRFSKAKMICSNDEESVHDGTGGLGAKWAFTTVAGISNDSRITVVQAKHNEIQPLTEADWKPAAGASEAKWTDGVLELTGGSGMVESVKEYGDFILQLEYFTEKGINSGVFFRCIPGETMNGYECQILNTPSDNDYNSFIGTDTGGIFRRQVGRNVGPKDGEWNYLTIAARGPDIATWVNGIQVTDWTDTRKEDNNPRNGKRLQPGTIQLQGHDPTTKILFRNFRIAEWEATP